MRIHILGIGGTFMAGIALLARALGHEVTGSDRTLWPPMSDQLARFGFKVSLGYRPENLDPAPDLALIGNVITRGNPELEALLERAIPYESGPRWLFEHVLRERTVIAVSGTHGKTTTSALLSHLLLASGRDCGYLIGGAPAAGRASARMGTDELFVIEADEYDTAFFDKEPKFLHYRPRIVILNNLEYDHADIYPDLDAIRLAFHRLIRIVPGNGRLVVNHDDREIARLLALGSWTPTITFGLDRCAAMHALIESEDARRFTVIHQGREIGQVEWSLLGKHNVSNALAALTVCQHLGLELDKLLGLFPSFRPPRRRLELLAIRDGIHVYDDFAHHPTAIRATLTALRAHVGHARIIVALEPRSNSMRAGVHQAALAEALADADIVLVLARPDLAWNVESALSDLASRVLIVPDTENLLTVLQDHAHAGDHVLFMSNGDFGGVAQRFAGVAPLDGGRPASVRPGS